MEKTMEKRYMDDYHFDTRVREDFVREIQAIQADSCWLEEIPGKALSVTSIQPIEVIPQANQYGLDEATLMDTADVEGTQLILHIEGGESIAMRNTCTTGLYQNVAGVLGSGLGRLWKRSSALFCEVLNEFILSQGNKVKLYKSCDKISGIFSAAYQAMEIPSLFKIAEDSFQEELGEPLFNNGHIEHAITSCTWEFPDAEAGMMARYQTLVGSKTKVYGTDFAPVVSFVTSNTGAYAATLTPMFCAPGKVPFRIGPGIRIRHESKMRSGSTGVGIEAFETQAKEMYAMFTSGIEAMGEMADMWIENPENAFISACNWCFGERLPRKLASNALEAFLVLNGNTPCTMHDVFLGISDINFEAEKANMGFERKLEISECIAKLLTTRVWKDFDVVGTVAWNGAKGGAL